MRIYSLRCVAVLIYKLILVFGGFTIGSKQRDPIINNADSAGNRKQQRSQNGDRKKKKYPFFKFFKPSQNFFENSTFNLIINHKHYI